MEIPLILNVIILIINLLITALIGPILVNWFRKKAIIKVNNEAEKIKFEIQRKYLLVEIRTRHLLEIYPKLYSAMLDASNPFIVYFSTIMNKIDELKLSGKEIHDTDLISLINEYFHPIFGNEYIAGSKALLEFSTQLTLSELFISDEVSHILHDVKESIQILWKIVAKEISFRKHQTYTFNQLTDLVDKSLLAVKKIETDQKFIARCMNKELDPKE